jgi:hypothetical protein
MYLSKVIVIYSSSHRLVFILYLFTCIYITLTGVMSNPITLHCINSEICVNFPCHTKFYELLNHARINKGSL